MRVKKTHPEGVLASFRESRAFEALHLKGAGTASRAPGAREQARGPSSSRVWLSHLGSLTVPELSFWEDNEYLENPVVNIVCVHSWPRTTLEVVPTTIHRQLCGTQEGLLGIGLWEFGLFGDRAKSSEATLSLRKELVFGVSK